MARRRTARQPLPTDRSVRIGAKCPKCGSVAKVWKEPELLWIFNAGELGLHPDSVLEVWICDRMLGRHRCDERVPITVRDLRHAYRTYAFRCRRKPVTVEEKEQTQTSGGSPRRPSL